MKKLSDSILIVSLNEIEGKSLAQDLANTLNLHYASCKEILEYDLFDSGAILEKCGIAYLNKREKSIMKDISMYENSLIFISYDLLQNNLRIFEKIYPKIFLKFPKRKLSKNDTINLIAYEERNSFLSKFCDLSVEVSSSSKSNLSKILKEIDKKV